MRVAIFNVKYSPNLGDGIIAECLETALRRRTGWHVVSLDLAGRTAYRSDAAPRRRSLALQLLRAMPQRLRDGCVELALTPKLHDHIGPAWRRELASCDFAVIGGGQLIQAFDLNFPLKLTEVLQACEDTSVPAALFAVGARVPHSEKGRHLFESLLKSKALVHIAARDESSAQTLCDLGRRASIARDPGLLAAQTWPIEAPQQAGAKRLVGVGVTHPSVLAYHASGTASPSQASTLLAYEQLIKSLVAAGNRVLVFTNGAGEDAIALRTIRARLDPATNPDVDFAPAPTTPGHLARLIASLDALVAHRLHAHIVAYSYRIPSVALSWDAKLDAFFASTARSSFVSNLHGNRPDEITSRLDAAIREGIAPEVHAGVMREAVSGIERLIGRIEASSMPRLKATGSFPVALVPNRTEDLGAS
ncbi:MAG: polysaccharide pyruvyl transferase family protein [Hyphomicrobiaceae bacterium]